MPINVNIYSLFCKKNYVIISGSQDKRKRNFTYLVSEYIYSVHFYTYTHIYYSQPSEEIISLFLNSQYSKPKFFPLLCVCFKQILLWLERKASFVYIVAVGTGKWIPRSTWGTGRRPCSCVPLMSEDYSLAILLIPSFQMWVYFDFQFSPTFPLVVFCYSSFSSVFSWVLCPYTHMCASMCSPSWGRKLLPSSWIA